MMGVDLSMRSPRDFTTHATQLDDDLLPQTPMAKIKSLKRAFTATLTQNQKQHRRMLFLLMVALFARVHLRVGAATRSEWTKSLTVFTILDVLCDMADIASIYEIFNARRRALAARAVNAGRGFVASRHQRDRGNGNNNMKTANNRSQGQRKRVTATLINTVRTSLQVAWSLNTILPSGHGHHHHSHEIRRPLMLELTSAIPIELLAFVLGPNALHMLRWLKLVRLYRVPGCIRELKQIYASSKVIQVMEYTANAILIRTVMFGLGITHWLACIYMIIANLECDVDYQRCSKGVAVAMGRRAAVSNPDDDEHQYTCWGIEDRLVGASNARKYGRAIYWASRTMVTVGYYDVAAVTDLETLYVIIVQIIGVIFSTRVVATCLFIFRYRGFRKQEFMTHVDNAKEYMRMRRFPDDVREGVLSYYKNIWATHQGKIVERLPEHLHVSVMGVLKVQRIQSVSFLAKESVEFVNTLALQLVLCVYSPKDWIVEKMSDGMYFALRGNVILQSTNFAQPRFVKPGEHFAEASLLYTGKGGDERARAQTFCELYKLAQQAFYKTLVTFYRNNAAAHMEQMQSMRTRHDQQEQKMKRMLGRAAEDFQNNDGSIVNFDANSAKGGKKKRFYHDWRLPGSTFRKWWEHGRLLLLIFVAYEVPFFIVFDSAVFPFGVVPKYNIQSIASIFVELFFVVDFVFRGRYFAYIDSLAMIPVHVSSYIFQAYKENGMWLDLVSILPVPLITKFSRTEKLTYEPFFRIVRLVRLRYFFQVMQDLAHYRGMSSKVQTTLTLLLCVTFTLHVSGCTWFLMSRFSYDADKFVPIETPITRDGCLQLATLYGNCSWAIYDAYGQIGTKFVVQDHESIYTGKFAYLRSLYWSIVSLTTVGYGDIVAFSTYESYFAAVWVFLGAIINYGVIGAMSNVISNLTASSHHHLEKMNHTNLVLAHFRISEHLRSQIRRYYHQQFYVQKVTSEVNLLEHLPHQLRHRISLISHSESVQKVPLFLEMNNERLLNDLTGLFRRRLYQRGDSFFPENNMCDEMYVVVSGRVDVFSKRVPSIPVGALSDGDCYGICELLLQKNFTTTLVAVTTVEVSVITQSAFLMTTERRFPDEVQTLRMRALQDHIFDTLSLEAIIENFKTRPNLSKYTEDCASMFQERDDSAHYNQKMRLRFYWDLLVFVMHIYNAFLVTFWICFLHHSSHKIYLAFVLVDFLTDLVLFADIYLKLYFFECESGFTNVFTRTEKDRHYVEHSLKQDLLSCLPLYYVGSNFFVMSLCRLPRLLQAKHTPAAMDSLIVRIQQRFSSGNIAAYLSPFKPVLILVFAAHFAGCGFYLISETDHNVNTWIHHDHVVHQEHESTAVLYLRSFYWAITTLTLVGSKEMTPLGIPGTLWATATCLCCTFVFGHIVDELSELVLELDKAKKELKEREASFEQYAKDHNLPISIRTRGLHFLKFQHTYLRGKDIYETFHDLPPNLRVQLMLDLHGNTIHNLCIAPFLNQSQINGLAVRLKSELFIPGDSIIVEGDLGHKLYLVKFGAAMVVWKATGTAVATLSAGSLFDEVAFFLRGQRRIASVQATTCCELLLLDRKSWDVRPQMNTVQLLSATGMSPEKEVYT
ncbi:Voltage-gated ion channel, partial [Globisporangium splendens]